MEQYGELVKRLAENLRDFRNAAGRSQEDLAHAAGITVRAYGAIERGTTMDPGLQTVHAVATALGIEIGDLLVRKRPGAKPSPLKRGRKPRPSKSR